MGVWNMSKALCDVWTSSDVLLCTASILNLCAISIDRYLTITRPLVYAAKRTPSRMALMILSVWMLSALISIPPLFGWRADPPPNQCELSQDVVYQFYATVGAFYLPLIVMIVIYYRIYVVSDHVRKTEAKLQPLNSSPSPGNCGGSSSPFNRSRAPSRLASQQCLYSPNNASQRHLSTGSFTNELNIQKTNQCSKVSSFGIGNRLEVYDPRIGKITPSVSHRRLSQQPPECKPGEDENEGKLHQRHSFDLSGVSFFSRRTSATPSQQSKGKPTGDRQSKSISFGRSSSSREHKTTKTLGIIMGSFIICWLPFFILALIRPLLPDPSVIPHWLGSGLQWLGFANSLLNPIIYARFNRDFRTPFKHILLCRCRDLDAKLRLESYAEKYGACHISFDGGSRIQLNSLNVNYGKNSRRESSIGSNDFIKITKEEFADKQLKCDKETEDIKTIKVDEENENFEQVAEDAQNSKSSEK